VIGFDQRFALTLLHLANVTQHTVAMADECDESVQIGVQAFYAVIHAFRVYEGAVKMAVIR
jgi:hypothetical protein